MKIILKRNYGNYSKIFYDKNEMLENLYREFCVYPEHFEEEKINLDMSRSTIMKYFNKYSINELVGKFYQDYEKEV